jgi:hypothetical protein
MRRRTALGGAVTIAPYPCLLIEPPQDYVVGDSVRVEFTETAYVPHSGVNYGLTRGGSSSSDVIAGTDAGSAPRRRATPR